MLTDVQFEDTDVCMLCWLLVQLVIMLSIDNIGYSSDNIVDVVMIKMEAIVVLFLTADGSLCLKDNGVSVGNG